MTVTTRDASQRVNRTVLASTISALLAGGGAAQAQETGLEEITVTGSRIVRRDLEAASPIVTIDTRAARELEHDQHRERPQSNAAVRARRHAVRLRAPQAGPTASLGIGSLNLRGIGANRTLVLVDGRRAQPANAALIVDINTIPSAAIERVETITGGASAVYGADAMAGVVNFILKDDFEGVEMDFQTGVTAEGDGEETRFTSLLGVNSGDGDGNVMLGVEWYHRGERSARRPRVLQERLVRPGQQRRRLPPSAGLLAEHDQPALPTGGPPTQAAVDRFSRPTPAATFPARSRRLFAASRSACRRQLRGRESTPRSSSTATARRSCWPARAATTRASTRRPELRHTGDGYAGVRLQPNGDLGQVAYEA